MIIADYVALGALLLFALIGWIVGFGAGLKFFTSHIFGFIISVVVVYFFFGVVSDLAFVQNLLQQFIDYLTAQGNTFCDILIKIRIDMIALAVVMFIIVQIVRVILVALLKGLVEIQNPVFKFFNRLFGMIFFVAIVVMLLLIAFQVIAWIGGTTATNFETMLENSVIKLDWLFANNPLRSVFEGIQIPTP